MGTADLVIACTSRTRSTSSRPCSRGARPEGDDRDPRLEHRVRRALARGQLDLDFIVSSELETAHAISRTIGVPAARQTDVFAEGQVQIVEFDVDQDAVRRP